MFPPKPGDRTTLARITCTACSWSAVLELGLVLDGEAWPEGAFLSSQGVDCFACGSTRVYVQSEGEAVAVAGDLPTHAGSQPARRARAPRKPRAPRRARRRRS